MDVTENARRFLENLHRFDLATLVSGCEVAVERVTRREEVFFEWQGVTRDVVAVRAPIPIDEALRSLPPEDRKRIAQAATSLVDASPPPDDIEVETMRGAVADGAVALLAELLIHRSMMMDVSTGGTRIQEVDDFYRARQARIVERVPDGVPYDNPHSDLWAFYHHWNANLPQYRDRRLYVRQLFAPAIAAVAQRTSLPTPVREATGWERVDRALSKARDLLVSASAEEDFQAIGLICREVIISLAQAVYEPELHGTPDGVEPSPTDANRMLDAYLIHAFPGASNKEVRAHVRASLALALNLQHRRTATRQLAALCVEAAASSTAVISIIARATV